MTEFDDSRDRVKASEGPGERTFHVRAPSINAVRRALKRAPGGVRVVGRADRETILCSHTMNEHSLGRHWAVILSRLSKEGMAVVRTPTGKVYDDK
jgi:hypothetical protein